MERLNKLQQQLAAQQALIAQLQAECADIEQEVTEVKQQHGITTGFRFLDLPRELRDMVYELCLAKGKVFLPMGRYDKYDVRHIDFHECDRPEWQLLSVDHQMRGEAAKVLLSQNQIVLAGEPQQSLTPMPDYSGPNGHLKLTDLAKDYLENVSIAWRRGNYTDDPEMAGFLWHDDTPLESVSQRQRAARTHSNSLELGGNWEKLLWSTLLARIKHIELDVTDCWCPLRCCRMVARMSDSFKCAESPFRAPFPYHGNISTITIAGTRTQTERLSITEALVQGIHLQLETEVTAPKPSFTLRFTKYVILEEPRSFFRSQAETHGLEDLSDEDVDIGAEYDKAAKEGRLLDVSEDGYDDDDDDDE